MELKTKVTATPDTQELLITRIFDLPVELLFKAYEDAAIVEQWMNTKVVKLENRNHGSYQFETTDPQGNVHCFHGTIHSFEKGRMITRTFEMANTSFPVQLEFLDFNSLTDDSSMLTMHIIFKSVAWRDALLKMPFAMGINMAHDRLQEIASTLK